MALIPGNDKLVLPGLWDAHCHAYAVGHMAKVADLSHSTSIEDMQERLRKKLQGASAVLTPLTSKIFAPPPPKK